MTKLMKSRTASRSMKKIQAAFVCFLVAAWMSMATPASAEGDWCGEFCDAFCGAFGMSCIWAISTDDGGGASCSGECG